MDIEQTVVALDWESMRTLTGNLADLVSVHRRPDVIVGIVRGGMVPAVMLAHRLGVRDVRALALTHTTAEGVNATKSARPVLHNPNSIGDLMGCDVLVVDDVAGTGDTITAARDLVITHGAMRIRTAVCALNAANWPSWRHGLRDIPQTPTYVGWRSEGWVIFPWENH